jgi:hypothetical protein
MPLQAFIQSLIRRSRTEYVTLQCALYYLILIKSHVPKFGFNVEPHDNAESLRPLQCGRRMFLSALILASKYWNDRNYSNRAWSKISGAGVKEIDQYQLVFLSAIDWKLHFGEGLFQRWWEIALNLIPSGFSQNNPESIRELKRVILRLKPGLSNSEEISTSAAGT